VADVLVVRDMEERVKATGLQYNGPIYAPGGRLDSDQSADIDHEYLVEQPEPDSEEEEADMPFDDCFDKQDDCFDREGFEV
jgi:hypothetical protein